MKVLFVDFDGVLNSRKYLQTCNSFGVALDPDCLMLLKRIISLTNAKIVLTTSWREHWDKDSRKCSETGKQINSIFEKYGLEIYDKTDSARYSREAQIEDWLALNAPVKSFAVLDDMFLDSFVLRGHFVRTSGYINGLDEQSANETVRILNGEL